MKPSKLFQSAGFAGAIFLTSFGASAQIENPPSVKGRWGLSTGLTLDRYKMEVTPYLRDKKLGLLPMVTFTHGKNQFELGPQFLLARTSMRQDHRYFGANFNYKRYFNGFGNRFVPYLFTGIGFSTTSSNTVQDFGNGMMISRYPYNYKQTGFNLSIGYGLEWLIGKHFYLGSSVSFNPGMYTVRRSNFMNINSGWGVVPTEANQTNFRLDFNVNAQIGYRFGK